MYWSFIYASKYIFHRLPVHDLLDHIEETSKNSNICDFIKVSDI